jgi:hypothetical protein
MGRGDNPTRDGATGMRDEESIRAKVIRLGQFRRTLLFNRNEIENEIEHLEGGADAERNRDIIVTLKAAAQAYDVRFNCMTTAINALNWALGERSDLMPITPDIEAA